MVAHKGAKLTSRARGGGLELEIVGPPRTLRGLSLVRFPTVQQHGALAGELYIDAKRDVVTFGPRKDFAQAVAIRDDVDPRPVEHFGFSICSDAIGLHYVDGAEHGKQGVVAHAETILVDE